MCGIAGKLNLVGPAVLYKDLQAMSDKIKHRGPDDQGIYISDNKNIGLVNRRLAVIDLSSKGHQPMNYLGKYWITYNGEIYNFANERSRLKKMGYKFHSNTDTEVILALYDKYGTRCLQYLRGMFAFVIYDPTNHILFAARDRIGKKPLKYFWNGNSFIFSSELKAILTQSEVKSKVNWIDIHRYLTYGYVPSPNTGFVNIQKLEPGHYITLDLKTGKMNKHQYWNIDFSQKLVLSEVEWTTKILEMLDESTRLRMISDVPVGAFLSGGVDSSTVVALMARSSNKSIKTFTIGFTDSEDERPHALRIVKKYKTEHTTLVAKPQAVEELLPQLAYQYEEPFADSSNIVTYLVSELARKYVTVVLNGDGGDENFAGYDRYSRLKRDVRLNSLMPFVRPLIMPAIGVLSKVNFPYATRSHKFLAKSKSPLADRFVTYNCYFKSEDRENIYTPVFYRQYGKFDTYENMRDKFISSSAVDPRDQALFADLTMYFPEMLLAKVDIASMAVSLEARSPFLDHKMIELAAKIPFDLKLKGNNQYKYILKKSVESILPYENIYRQKVGFSIPLHKWFSGKLNTYARSVLLGRRSMITEFVNKSYINSALNTHKKENDFGPQIWSLLSLELWFRNYHY